MDKSQLRNRVFRDLLTSPWTLAPAVFGAGALMYGLWDASLAAGFWGFVGLLGAAGALASRWILKGDAITEKAFNELQGEALRQKEEALDDLGRRLKRDDDPSTDQSLKRLRSLYETYKNAVGWRDSVESRVSLEISGKLERLFAACVASLERSLELWHAAGRMATEAGRRRMLEKRQRLLEEVDQSIGQFAATIDSVQAMSVERETTARDLAELRRELDLSLDVARRVEERMRGLESELNTEVARERI